MRVKTYEEDTLAELERKVNRCICGEVVKFIQYSSYISRYGMKSYSVLILLED